MASAHGTSAASQGHWGQGQPQANYNRHTQHNGHYHINDSSEDWHICFTLCQKHVMTHLRHNYSIATTIIYCTYTIYCTVHTHDIKVIYSNKYAGKQGLWMCQLTRYTHDSPQLRDFYKRRHVKNVVVREQQKVMRVVESFNAVHLEAEKLPLWTKFIESQTRRLPYARPQTHPHQGLKRGHQTYESNETCRPILRWSIYNNTPFQYSL